jgi:peptide deformylase
MTVRPIRQLGDPVLRQPGRDVDRFDSALVRLAEDMAETMYDAPGVGLAAPQIGLSLRLFVFDPDPSERHGWTALCNPELTGLEGEIVMEEGCLSIRGPYAETPRAARVLVRAVDLAGEPVEFVAEDFVARIMQHETDHLNGMLYIDRLTDEGRRDVMRQLREGDFR